MEASSTSSIPEIIVKRGEIGEKSESEMEASSPSSIPEIRIKRGEIGKRGEKS